MLTITEATSEALAAQGQRSFVIAHETPDKRRTLCLTINSEENLTTWYEAAQGASPLFSGDSQTLVRNGDLAHLLIEFSAQLLHLSNLTHLGGSPVVQG